jgi:dTDP-glucose 4,6-dehydratase
LRPIVVTGGAGFIGSNFILHWLAQESAPIVNVDKLTYAGNLQNLEKIAGDPRHTFVKCDINKVAEVSSIFDRHQPAAVVHFAAESHVDRSIHGAEDFIQTNIVGTFNLLQSARSYWTKLGEDDKQSFRFLHVSTDEVYGSLEQADPAFTEATPFAPNSPYSASKASADHLVRAFQHTYQLPTLTTNCSNNYGPYQFPEKLIPLVIHRALSGKPLPIYGDGQNVRDWLYVADHCAAIRRVLQSGRIGQTYNIGGESEKTNLAVVKEICSILAELRPGRDYHSQVEFVSDRPGHDRRYAIDITKIREELGWKPAENFATGIRKTVSWYLENADWVESVTSGAYRDWIDMNYQSGSRQAIVHGR